MCVPLNSCRGFNLECTTGVSQIFIHHHHSIFRIPSFAKARSPISRCSSVLLTYADLIRSRGKACYSPWRREIVFNVRIRSVLHHPVLNGLLLTWNTPITAFIVSRVQMYHSVIGEGINLQSLLCFNIQDTLGYMMEEGKDTSNSGNHWNSRGNYSLSY